MMRRLTICGLLILCAAAASAQTPCNEVNLEEMTFVRQSFVRNFYNCSKVMSSINMDGTDLFLDNAANLIVEGDAVLSQQGGRLLFRSESSTDTRVRVGTFHPYLCYEAEFADVTVGDGAGITFDRGAITGRYSYGTLYFYLGDKMLASGGRIF